MADYIEDVSDFDEFLLGAKVLELVLSQFMDKIMNTFWNTKYVMETRSYNQEITSCQ